MHYDTHNTIAVVIYCIVYMIIIMLFTKGGDD